jgi:crossover junction endodeoxyribonuclease RusA
VVNLQIPLPPSVNRLWRTTKNVGGMYRSAKYTAWIKEAYAMILIQMRGQKRVRGEYKLTIECTKPDRRKRDLDNILKALSDILTHSGVIEDDSLCVWLEARWVEVGPPCSVVIQGVNELSTAPK